MDSKQSFVAIGEILWDMLPSGRVLGGAPANVAWHVAQLGTPSVLISAVGDDEPGRAALDGLRRAGMPVDCVAVLPGVGTGAADVTLAADGSAAYVIRADVAWDRIPLNAATVWAVGGAAAVCFGSLSQRTEAGARAVRGLLAAAHDGCFIVYDANLRPGLDVDAIVPASLGLATVVRLSAEELSVMAGRFGWGGDEDERARAMLAAFPNVRHLVVTKGADGAVWLTGGMTYRAAGRQIAVVDSVGAGDSFTAAVSAGLLAGMSIPDILDLAVAVSSHVCGCTGAMPPLPDEITNRVRRK